MQTGIILAGGAGSRMGGLIKALVRYHGRPLLAHAVDALAPHCDEILIMAGPHAAAISREAEGARVLADPGEGPHVALRIAAAVARRPTLVVVPADSPFIAPAVTMLVGAGPNAVAREGAGVNPLVGVYARTDLARLLQAPVRSMQEVAAKLRPQLRELDAPAGATADVDEPQDLNALERSRSR